MKDRLYRLLNWAELSRFNGTAVAVRAVLSEEGNATQPNAAVLPNSEAVPMPAMPPARQMPAFGQESGFVHELWAWPGMPEPVSVLGHGAPLLSRASCVEIEPESPRAQAESIRRQKHMEVAGHMMGAMLGAHMAMETAKLSCLLNPSLSEDCLRSIFGAPPKHRFIYLDGSERKERAAQ